MKLLSQIDLFTIIRYGDYAAQNEAAIILNTGELKMSAVMRPLEAAVAENAQWGTAFHLGEPGNFALDPELPLADRPSIEDIGAVVSFTFPQMDGDWHVHAYGQELASNFQMSEVPPNTLFFGLAKPGSTRLKSNMKHTLKKLLQPLRFRFN